MSMTPLHRPRRYVNDRDMPLFVAFIAILFVAIFVFGIDRISGGAVRSYARQGGGALWAAASAGANALTGSGALDSKQSLIEENGRLREEIAKRDENATRYAALAAENESLREMLGLVAEEGITVPVLSSFTSSPYGSFRIGGGVAAGIEEGSIVLTPGGYVLGAVTFVSARTATVEAFFSPGKEIEMHVNGFPFMADGRGGGNARGEVPRDAQVAVNDPVIVPAFGGRTAGIVGKIESASSSAYTTLFIRIPRNLDSLRYVHVLPLQ
jgi:cell shape-determining protein MreC